MVRPGRRIPATAGDGASLVGGRRLDYAWVVFAVSFVTLVAAAGFRSTPGILVDPLRNEFGWGRAEVGTAVSINVLLFGLMGPFAAALMGRFGLKRVVVWALCAISVGAALTTQMTQLWQLYLLWGVVVGLGSGCMATVFASTVASRWFVARRGIVTGALTAATASGQLVFLPLLSSLAEHHGWRWVGITIAVSAVSVVPLVILFLRDSPESMGLRPYGAPDDFAPAEPVAHPITAAFEGLRGAWTAGGFWLLVGSFFVCGLSTNGLIQTHFLSAASDHGISETSAAGLLATIGVFDVIGTVGSGWLTDRVDPRRLLVFYYSLRGLSLLLLNQALGPHNVGLLGFMVFYGLDWVATVPPTVALCNELFGRVRAPIVYGWVFAGHQMGAALAAWGAGELRDVTGSYQLAFVLAGAACLVAAIGVLRIPGAEDELRVGPLVSVEASAA
jgi:MFS family permease